jgi:hypothetical protein
VVRSNLKEIQGVYHPSVWVLVHPMQGEGDNSPITSFPYNSKEKLFVLWTRVNHKHKTLRNGWWVDRKYFFIGFQFPSPKP